MARRRRTKKQYGELFDNPAALFGSAEVTLWPNGEPEIWIRGKGSHSIRIRASEGPAGFGLTISTHAGATPMSVRMYDKDYKDVVQRQDGVREVCLTAYNNDPRAQAFKRWYDNEETAEDVALLGPEYARQAKDKAS